jgi:hypothetical protein
MNIAHCPICGSSVDPQKQTCFLLFQETLPPWFVDSARSGKSPDYEKLNWACDFCLDQGKALLANPRKQKYSDHWPHYAYRDKKQSCADCGKKFTVESWEQKYWYETLQFWTPSSPQCCKSCYQKRKDRRTNLEKRQHGPN